MAVVTPAEKGWLTVPAVVAHIADTFGLRVAPRTVQQWCRRRTNPLPATRVGHVLLVHRDNLTRWIGNGWPTEATATPVTQLTR